MRETRLSSSMSGLCQEDEKSPCCTKDEGGPFGCAKKKKRRRGANFMLYER